MSLRPFFFLLITLLFVGCDSGSDEPEELSRAQAEYTALLLEQSIASPIGTPGAAFGFFLEQELDVVTTSPETASGSFCTGERTYAEATQTWTISRSCGIEGGAFTSERDYAVQFFDASGAAGANPAEAVAASLTIVSGSGGFDGEGVPLSLAFALTELGGTLRVDGLGSESLTVSGTYTRSQRSSFTPGEDSPAGFPLEASELATTLDLNAIALTVPTTRDLFTGPVGRIEGRYTFEDLARDADTRTVDFAIDYAAEGGGTITVGEHRFPFSPFRFDFERS